MSRALEREHAGQYCEAHKFMCCPSLRCLLHVGLFEQWRAELRDDAWAAFEEGFLVDVLAITFQYVVGCLRFSVRAGLHALE